MICLPVLFFATIFLALFGAQIIQKDHNRSLTTFVFGIVLTAILSVLCIYTSGITTWMIVAVFSVAIALYMMVQGGVFNSIASKETPSLCPCEKQEQSCGC
jgi:uncharacterized membrane protein YgaE (UPF0421/DUF939 family)